ncbi:MAG: UDP-N-acetylmuramate dehydrogenase [Janthinobacterium lividum]
MLNKIYRQFDTDFDVKPESETDILKSLPRVRGRYSEDIDLSKLTWFRVGGSAQVLYKPADLEDLKFFLQNKPKDLPVLTLGVGSNLLVRDGGIPGVVIRLNKGFANILVKGTSIDVGAGMLDRTVSFISCQENLAGLEFLSGIPGTIGGALRMNAGCYGQEIKDCLEVAFAIDGQGKFQTLTPEDMGFQYRYCAIPEDWIFIGARLKTKPGSGDLIQARIEELLTEREKAQPVKTRTGGSTFANPEGFKAWQLIDQAGCRGLRRGGAQVSDLHCNFLMNTGEATAQDLEDLGEEVHKRVKQASGVDLSWEIKRVGVHRDTHYLKGSVA